MFFNKTLFQLEFKRSFKSMIVWSLSLAAMMVFVIAVYPMVKDMYATIPPEYASFLESFGGIPTNILEYFATEGAMMLQLFGAIYAAIEGYNIISRDEREKVVETLYQLPYKREVILGSKLAKVIVNVLLFSIINGVVSLITFWIMGESINNGLFLQFNLLNTVMFLMMAVFSFALSSFTKNASKSSIAIAIPFVFYVISILSTITNNKTLEALKYLTPYGFCDPVAIMKEQNSVEWMILIVFFVMTGALFYVSSRLFKKREIGN